jgi:hypothetical protein
MTTALPSPGIIDPMTMSSGTPRPFQKNLGQNGIV